MPEGLSVFQAYPRHAVNELLLEHDGALMFIIDTQRQPDAMARLYQVGEDLSLHYLYAETELAALAQEGPIWFSAPRASGLARLGMQLCQERQAGIVLSAADEQAALAHARWLLRVHDHSGGECLIAFHLPAIWAALALTAADRAMLLGPWDSVFSPAPCELEPPELWLAWSVSGRANDLGSGQARFALAEATPAYIRTLRWAYWIDEEHKAFGSPSLKRLPELIVNLETLVEHRIYEGRHLLKLADLLESSPISERQEVMSILRGAEEAFIKVERLQALSVTLPAA